MLSFLQSVAATPRVSGSLSFLSSLPLPAQFPWQPDFGVFNEDGVYSTNYKPENDKPAGAPVWVSTSGDDSSGDGSEANPYRSIKTARENGSVVHIKSGFYADSTADFAMGVSEDMALVAVDGPGSVIWASAPESLVWTLESGNVYRAGVGNAVDTVVDLTLPRAGEFLKDGVSGLPDLYSEQSSINDVQNNAGSFYYNSGVLYLHTHDGRLPDDSIKPLWNKSIWSTINVQHTVYLEGIEFWGADPLLLNGQTVLESSKLVAVDCGFRFSNTGSNVRCVSIKSSCLVRCAVSDSFGDGFSYANNSSVFEQTILELDCTAIRSGRVSGGDDNNNGSTAHKNCSVIRINSVYDTSQGPVVADVLGTHALCFNVDSRNANSDRGDNHSSDASFSAGSFGANDRVTRMWLFDCKASGSGHDRTVSTGGTIISDANFIGAANDDSGIILPFEDDNTPAFYNDLTLWFDFDHDATIKAGGSGIIEVSDKSPQKKNARQSTSSRRLPTPAIVPGLFNGRKVTSPDDRLDDSSLDMVSDITIGDLYIVASFKDGTDADFDNFETLVSGPGASGTPRILGLTGTADISDTAHALSDIAVNGALAAFTGILPLPFSILRMTPDTPKSALYTFFRHKLSDERGWPGNIAEILAFETAKTVDEDNAIRAYLAAKWF